MQRWLVCALCAPRLFCSLSRCRSRVIWSLAMVRVTIVRISSRCVQRCAFCLHAGASMLSDIAICCVVQRSGHAARALSLRGVFFGLWALPHAGFCVVWSLQCMVRAGVLVWPREGSNFWSRWTRGRGFIVTQVTYILFLRICTSNGCDMYVHVRTRLSAQRNLFCVATNLPSP